MNAAAPLPPDGAQLASFFDALFRYADEGTYLSQRGFYDLRNAVFRIRAHPIEADPHRVLGAITAFASDCAASPEPVVYCPPVATFIGPNNADEAGLACGLALSVECDQAPAAARARLEALLGTATVIVASGGECVDAATGEIEPKLHLHWRLNEPTRDPDAHQLLKQARALATRLVGGDASNKPVVHPIRWPGSWHRKSTPRLARIVALTDCELDLSEALERLQEAAAAAPGTGGAEQADPGASIPPEGEERDTAELIRAILTGADYHTPIAALAMRVLKGGMPDAQVVLHLRGVMQGVPPELRDLKDGTVHPGRWQARYSDIPRAVRTARAELGAAERQTADADGWPEPVDFFDDDRLTGTPELRPEHLPEALWPFVTDTAERMGVDPAAVALAAIVSCASVISETWRVQPKQHDTTWTEEARLWGAIVGPPSILKTPVISACTKPVDKLDAAARRQHATAMRAYKEALAAWKQTGRDAGQPEPSPPKLDRYLVEGTTVEALSEVLRDDDEARQNAPQGKVLVRQDELSEWLGNLDRYRAGGKGGGDRGAYLRLFNGGRFTVDRIGRGSFSVPNWSACLLGGIQPEPIQRIAREAADDGLLQRFLYVVPGAQERGQDRMPDQAATRRYEALFPALVGLLPPACRFMGQEMPGDGHGQVVVLHADAHKHRLAIDNLAEAISALPGQSNRLKAALGKWRGLFARLALVFHLIEAADAIAQGQQPPYATVLSEANAGRAAQLLQMLLLPHLLRADALMFSTTQTSHARWIAGLVLAKAQPRITLRDVVQAYGALRAPEHRRELLDVMESLVSVGWLRPEEQANPYRPPSAWGVNPKVHTVFAARAADEKEGRAERQAEAREHFGQPRGRADAAS